MTVALLAISLVLSQNVQRKPNDNPFAGVQFKNPMAGMLAPALTQKLWAKVVARTAKKPELIVEPPFSARPILETTDFTPAGPRMVPASILGPIPKQRATAILRGFEQSFDGFEAETRKNNLSWALALLLATSVQVSYDKEVADADLRALVRDFNDVLAADKAFIAQPSKQKQALYEASLSVAFLMGGMVEASTQLKDPALKKQARAIGDEMLTMFQAK